MDLMGGDTRHSEEAFHRMWGDSIKAVKCQQHARITYQDFLLLMKGQTKDTPSSELERELNTSASALHALSARSTLAVVHEAPVELEDRPSSADGADENAAGVRRTTTTPTLAPRATLPLPKPLEGVKRSVTESALLHSEAAVLPFRSVSPVATGTQSAPTTPADHRRILEFEELDSPPSMDTDVDIVASGPGIPGSAASLTPPQSPVRGARDYVTPMGSDRFTVMLPNNVDSIMVPGLPSIAKPEPYTRRRSRSLGGGGADGESESESKEQQQTDLHGLADAVRDMIVPEGSSSFARSSLNDIVRDESKSNLAVNRKLYRAHRQMRLAVLEASKRFEEQQAEHARDVLLAQHEAEGKHNEYGVIQAGLVMRHGTRKQVTSEAIRTLLRENQKQQQALVEKFARRGGRGRRSRKKTISDMSGMLSSMGADEMGGIAAKAMASEDFVPPPILEEAQSMGNVGMFPPPDEVEGHLRHATVPGEFRKTSDPFSKQGRYGSVIAWDPNYPQPPTPPPC